MNSSIHGTPQFEYYSEDRLVGRKKKQYYFRLKGHREFVPLAHGLNQLDVKAYLKKPEATKDYLTKALKLIDTDSWSERVEVAKRERELVKGSRDKNKTAIAVTNLNRARQGLKKAKELKKRFGPNYINNLLNALEKHENEIRASWQKHFGGSR